LLETILTKAGRAELSLSFASAQAQLKLSSARMSFSSIVNRKK
jgi:hypothetical protein